MNRTHDIVEVVSERHSIGWLIANAVVSGGILGACVWVFLICAGVIP